MRPTFPWSEPTAKTTRFPAFGPPWQWPWISPDRHQNGTKAMPRAIPGNTTPRCEGPPWNTDKKSRRGAAVALPWGKQSCKQHRGTIDGSMSNESINRSEIHDRFFGFCDLFSVDALRFELSSCKKNVCTPSSNFLKDQIIAVVYFLYSLPSIDDSFSIRFSWE